MISFDLDSKRARLLCSYLKLTVLLWMERRVKATSNWYVISSEHDDNVDKLRAIGVFLWLFYVRLAKAHHIQCLYLDSNCSAFRHHWRSSISLWFFVICDVWNGTLIAYVECIAYYSLFSSVYSAYQLDSCKIHIEHLHATAPCVCVCIIYNFSVLSVRMIVSWAHMYVVFVFITLLCN